MMRMMNNKANVKIFSIVIAAIFIIGIGALAYTQMATPTGSSVRFEPHALRFKNFNLILLLSSKNIIGMKHKVYYIRKRKRSKSRKDRDSECKRRKYSMHSSASRYERVKSFRSSKQRDCSSSPRVSSVRKSEHKHVCVSHKNCTCKFCASSAPKIPVLRKL